MRCPNGKCRREVTRLVMKATPTGKILRGCRACVPLLGEKNVRTGRKIWTGEDVDGVEGNRRKIHEFGEKIKRRAAATHTRSALRESKD